jgi:hypothetical protein
LRLPRGLRFPAGEKPTQEHAGQNAERDLVEQNSEQEADQKTETASEQLRRAPRMIRAADEIKASSN